MAYFGHAHWRKGDKFSRELDFWLISIMCSDALLYLGQAKLVLEYLVVVVRNACCLYMQDSDHYFSCKLDNIS